MFRMIDVDKRHRPGAQPRHESGEPPLPQWTTARGTWTRPQGRWTPETATCCDRRAAHTTTSCVQGLTLHPLRATLDPRAEPDPSAPRDRRTGHARRPGHRPGNAQRTRRGEEPQLPRVAAEHATAPDPASAERRSERSRPRRTGGGAGKMARTSSEAVQVMERDTATKTKRATATALRQLSGPYGASFDGSDGHGHETKG